MPNRRRLSSDGGPLWESCQKCSHCCCLRGDLPLFSERYFILGIIQLLCGAISIVITVFAVLQRVCLHAQGTGAWAGAFMMAAGVLGMLCARRKTVCAVVTLLVLCVLATIAATLQSTFSIRGLLLELQSNCGQVPTNYAAAGQHDSSLTVRRSTGGNFRNYVIHALLLIFGLLEFGVAVGQAVLCSRLICCQTLFTLPLESAPGAASNRRFPNRRPGQLNFVSGTPHVILADPALHSAVSGRHLQCGPAAGAGGNGAGAFVFVMPSPSSAEPTLIFPTPPPPYSGGERRSLLYTGDSVLQPAVILSEEPPEYQTVDPRRSRLLDNERR